MTTQPEALRLAEFYEALAEEPPKSPDNSNIRAAAAELRRLHASCEDYAQHKQRQDQRVLELAERVLELKAQRDALLKLLKEARKIIRATSSRNLVKDWDQRTTAAIKAVEGEKT